MKSRTTDHFWKYYEGLSDTIKKQAKGAYKKFQEDPYYPSLHFKRVHSNRPIFSVRITRDCRSVGIQHENEMIWFWIGNHSDYDSLLKKMRKD